MTPRRFALASTRVVTPDGVRHGAVVIADGRIEAVVARDEVVAGVPVEDLGGLVISPGVVDTHVHINEPGRTDWEGFETATRAAAAGGVTTLIDMPLNSSPVTTTVAALEEKRSAAQGKCWGDVGFYGGLIPGNLEHIEPLIDAGVCGVKAFMCDSGLAEFPAASLDDLRAAMPILARRGVPLLVHAELAYESSRPEFLELPATCQSFFDSRWGMEQQAIGELRCLVERTRCPTHVVHVSCSLAAASIQAAKAAGLPMTAETCPHYLTFVAEEIADHDTRFKCAPPIYNRENRGDLWRALQAGVIDTIGSDHSPCPPDMKYLDDGDLSRAWGGISSLQLTLSAVWTEAVKRSVALDRLAVWLSEKPAALVGLNEKKGRIAAGYDADLCLWDPDKEWTVRGADLQHRHKLTPYEGKGLRGRVKQTYVRGQLVYNEGEFPAGPIGELLQRPLSPRSMTGG